MGSQLLKAEGNESEERVASFGNLAVLNAGLNVATGPCKKVRCSSWNHRVLFFLMQTPK